MPLNLHIVYLFVLLRGVLYPYTRECNISIYLSMYTYIYTLESSAALRAALIRCVSKIEGQVDN